MKIKGKSIAYIFLILMLFGISQLACDFSVGAVGWFVMNMPEGRTLSEFPSVAFWAEPALQYAMQWLAILCLAAAIYFLMEKRKIIAFMLLLLPLVPASISFSSFYQAAQMHVAPGEGLFSSGVLIGKKSSYAKKENASSEQVNTGESLHEH